MSDPLHFTNARLIDPEALTDRTGSLTIDAEGKIAAIDTAPPEGVQVIDCNGKCLAPGIVDWGAKLAEPGERDADSLAAAAAAAAAGGVTTIIAQPDAMMTIDTPEALEYLTRRSDGLPVNIRYMAALTRNRSGTDAGTEMVEIGFLRDAGAIAFTDGPHNLPDTRLLARTLSYAKAMGALIVGHPQDCGLSAGAVATSGKFASLYGLPAVSPMAERMGLERDLALVEMTGAGWHADQITTAAALPAIRRAKEAGLDVSFGTSIHHLTLNEFDVEDYRSYFRFIPPLRSEDDRMAIVDALAEGLIDTIGSFHTPQDDEAKRLPFADAAPGAVGLQTLLPAAMRLYHAGISLPQLWRAMSLNPAKRLGLPAGRLAVGAPADLVLFNPDAPFILDRFSLLSHSKNTPYDGTRMEGRVLGTWLAGKRVHGATTQQQGA